MLTMPTIMPGTADAGVLADTFGKGGVGYSMVQLLVIAAFAALIIYIVQALGYGQVASMIKLVAVFGCISIVITQVWNAISKVAGFFGVAL